MHLILIAHIKFSKSIEANRQEYQDQLLIVSQRGEWEAWPTFFLEDVRSQANEAARRIVRPQKLARQLQQGICKMSAAMPSCNKW